MHTLQNQMPWVSGEHRAVEPQPSQPPTAKAASIIRKPLSAEAAPAACGKGPTAPLWPQGWCTPCANMKSQKRHQRSAQTSCTPASASTPSVVPPASVKRAAMATVRRTPKRGSRRRHRKVPRM